MRPAHTGMAFFVRPTRPSAPCARSISIRPRRAIGALIAPTEHFRIQVRLVRGFGGGHYSRSDRRGARCAVRILVCVLYSIVIGTRLTRHTPPQKTNVQTCKFDQATAAARRAAPASIANPPTRRADFARPTRCPRRCKTVASRAASVWCHPPARPSAARVPTA
jgi:hypothetical protein